MFGCKSVIVLFIFFLFYLFLLFLLVFLWIHQIFFIISFSTLFNYIFMYYFSGYPRAVVLKTIFIIVLKHYLPFHSHFSHESRLIFFRNYMTGCCKKLNEGDLRIQLYSIQTLLLTELCFPHIHMLKP